MKRLMLAAAFFLMSLCFGETLSAGNFGVLGGANFHTYDSSKMLTKWHAGLTYKVNLPVGFQLQPAVLYSEKAASYGNVSSDLSAGYLELMASMQWGIDLILFRPFVEVCPFAGYGLGGSSSLKDVWAAGGDKWEYGVGLGGGLQIWRFQLGARYNWNFSNAGIAGADFSAVTLSLAYFF